MCISALRASVVLGCLYIGLLWVLSYALRVVLYRPLSIIMPTITHLNGYAHLLNKYSPTQKGYFFLYRSVLRYLFLGRPSPYKIVIGSTSITERFSGMYENTVIDLFSIVGTLFATCARSFIGQIRVLTLVKYFKNNVDIYEGYRLILAHWLGSHC